MATYIILSTYDKGSFEHPRELPEAAENVKEQLQNECPNVTWKASYSTMGQYDVVDVVESDDPAAVQEAAMIIRSYGFAQTETMAAVEWADFMEELA